MLPRWVPPGIRLVLHWNVASLYSPSFTLLLFPLVLFPTPSVRGETRTAEIQTIQHAYSRVAHVRLYQILSVPSIFVLVDKRVEISVSELVGPQLIC